MSDKAPLFLSAMELYAHAVELYASKRQRNFKFVILHLANSIELLLKDALLDLGESVYKSPKETLSIWAAMEVLEKHKVGIPEKPRIELLIDDRNNIQHRFGSPDERSTFYYLDEVGKFLRRFLAERYALRFDEVILDYLEPEYLPLVGVTPAGPEAKVKALLQITPPMAAVEAYEDWLERFRASVDWEHGELNSDGVRMVTFQGFLRDFSARGYLEDAYKKWQILKAARDGAAHGQTSGVDWGKALGYYFEFLKAFDLAKKAGYMYQYDPHSDDSDIP